VSEGSSQFTVVSSQFPVSPCAVGHYGAADFADCRRFRENRTGIDERPWRSAQTGPCPLLDNLRKSDACDKSLRVRSRSAFLDQKQGAVGLIPDFCRRHQVCVICGSFPSSVRVVRVFRGWKTAVGRQLEIRVHPCKSVSEGSSQFTVVSSQLGLPRRARNDMFRKQFQV